MKRPSSPSPPPVGLRGASGRGTQSLGRALGLLRLISTRNRAGVPLHQAAAESGMSKTTVFRLLRELRAAGLVAQDEARRYHLGQFALELGLVAASAFNQRDLCSDALRRVAEETGDTVLLVTRSGLDSFFLDCKVGGFPARMDPIEIGYRQPLGIGPGGLAYLSYLPPEEREAITRANAPRLGAYQGVTVEQLFERIARTLARGYALLEDFHRPDLVGIGMPVLDPAGRPSVSISVSSMRQRMTPSHRESVLRVLQRETVRMRTALFGSAHGHPGGAH